MYNDFIKSIDGLLLEFKTTGDIKYMLKLEGILYCFLESTILDYLDNEDATEVSSNTNRFHWVSNDTL